MTFVEINSHSGDIMAMHFDATVAPQPSGAGWEVYEALTMPEGTTFMVEGMGFDIGTQEVFHTTKSNNILHEDYLRLTDWYAIREFETGTAMPADVRTKRQAARDAIVR